MFYYLVTYSYYNFFKFDGPDYKAQRASYAPPQSEVKNEWMNGLFSVTMCNIEIVCNQMTKKKKPYIQIFSIYSLTTKLIQLCQAQNLLWVILFCPSILFLETQQRSAQLQSITETISLFNSPQKNTSTFNIDSEFT